MIFIYPFPCKAGTRFEFFKYRSLKISFAVAEKKNFCGHDAVGDINSYDLKKSNA